jgi:hypothetical protein
MEQIDIRFPLGLLLLLIGAILTVYGIASDRAIYVTHSLGQNVNVIWGSIFGLLGLVILWLARRRRTKA